MCPAWGTKRIYASFFVVLIFAIYVDYDNQFNGTGKRSLKDSYYWYKKVTASNGEDLG